MIKFNEAHPFLAKMIQGFLLLLPILFLILSPLAIGIGLFGSLSAAWAMLAPLIMPLVAGFATVAGTVAIVAAVLVGLVAVFYLLWTKCDWFKEGLISAWNSIAEATKTAWDWVLNSVLIPVWDAIVSFGKDMMDKFSKFWDEHGQQIVDIIKTYFTQAWSQIEMVMGIIKGIFEMVWPIISGFVEIAWNLIELTIGNGIDIILGLIEAGLALLEGDWEGAWDAILGIAEDIWGNIQDFFEDVDLYEIGANIIDGLLEGLSSMAGAITKRVESLASLVPDGLKDFLGIHSPSRLIKTEVGKWIPLGLSEGIDDNLGYVEDSVSRMSKTSVPNLSDMNMDEKRIAHAFNFSNEQSPNSKSTGDTNITINARTVDIDKNNILRTLQRLEALHG
jgi:phage-related protein